MNVASEAESQVRLLETAAVTFTLPEPLSLEDARRLRGAVVAAFGGDGPGGDLLHQHGAGGVLHRSPLVRFDTAGGAARMVGIGEGALAVRGLPRLDRLRLGDREVPVLDQTRTVGRCEVGPTTEPAAYRFLTPYLALNQENDRRFRAAGRGERGDLLARVVVGNLLSFSQGVGVNVIDRLTAGVDLRPAGRPVHAQAGGAADRVPRHRHRELPAAAGVGAGQEHRPRVRHARADRRRRRE